jgi:DNA-nicking Smr family endonuclease
MDFGDILDAYDTAQRRPVKEAAGGIQRSHKKANAPTAEEKVVKATAGDDGQNAAQINPMEFWLRRYGTVDKDAAAEQFQEQTKMENREYVREMRPEARLDLHGLTRDEAWERLEQFVEDCSKRGLQKVLIVHGKGNHTSGSDPVLGPMVRSFIEQDKRMGMSGHPDHTQGGSGATWVVLKK